MKKSYFFLFPIVQFLFFAAFSVQAQQVFKTTGGTVIGYLEYLPSDYEANSNRYPIVIFLHGIGERGANSTDPAVLATTIQNVAKIGPPMYAKNGYPFPFILISPQLKNNYGTWPAWYVLEVINHVKNYLRVDEKRIYLTGLSLGGGGVWMTAQDFPELFAAIAPVCGGYNTPSKACNIASENLPVWAFHGDKDTVVPMSKSINMVNAINNCLPKPNPLAIMTIYPGVGHSAWNNAYKTDNTVHNPNVYQWMLAASNTINKGNKLPVANAGSDKTVAPGLTTLTGSGTDPDGTIASFSWAQLAGPAPATLTNVAGNTLTAANLEAGSYVFRLTVKDNSGNADSDYVRVTVSGVAANIAPVVNAGADRNINLPSNAVSLTATASDADGSIVKYVWSKTAGPAATLSGTSTTTLKASYMTAGIYNFRIVVTDNLGSTKTDDVIVTVNNPPVVSAGQDQTVLLPANSLTLTGTATDVDGTIKSYAWTKVSGSTVSMSGANTATMTASNLLAGSYVFRLTVSDNKGAKKTDDVAVTVKDQATTNIAPVANAGPNKILTMPANAVTVYGSGSDADGHIVSYSWRKTKGGTVTMTGTNTPTLKLENLVVGSYYFRLTVTDNNGAVHYDNMLVSVKDGVAALEVEFAPAFEVEMIRPILDLQFPDPGPIKERPWYSSGSRNAEEENGWEAGNRALAPLRKDERSIHQEKGALKS